MSPKVDWKVFIFLSSTTFRLQFVFHADSNLAMCVSGSSVFFPLNLGHLTWAPWCAIGLAGCGGSGTPPNLLRTCCCCWASWNARNRAFRITASACWEFWGFFCAGLLYCRESAIVWWRLMAARHFLPHCLTRMKLEKKWSREIPDCDVEPKLFFLRKLLGASPVGLPKVLLARQHDSAVRLGVGKVGTVDAWCTPKCNKWSTHSLTHSLKHTHHLATQKYTRYHQWLYITQCYLTLMNETVWMLRIFYMFLSLILLFYLSFCSIYQSSRVTAVLQRTVLLH